MRHIGAIFRQYSLLFVQQVERRYRLQVVKMLLLDTLLGIITIYPRLWVIHKMFAPRLKVGVGIEHQHLQLLALDKLLHHW